MQTVTRARTPRESAALHSLPLLATAAALALRSSSSTDEGHHATEPTEPEASLPPAGATAPQAAHEAAPRPAHELSDGQLQEELEALRDAPAHDVARREALRDELGARPERVRGRERAAARLAAFAASRPLPSADNEDRARRLVLEALRQCATLIVDIASRADAYGCIGIAVDFLDLIGGGRLEVTPRVAAEAHDHLTFLDDYTEDTAAYAARTAATSDDWREVVDAADRWDTRAVAQILEAVALEAGEVPAAEAVGLEVSRGAGATAPVAPEARGEAGTAPASVASTVAQVPPVALLYAARYHAEAGTNGPTLDELAALANAPHIVPACEAIEALASNRDRALVLHEVLMWNLGTGNLGAAERRFALALGDLPSTVQSAQGTDFGDPQLAIAFNCILRLLRETGPNRFAFECLHAVAAYLRDHDRFAAIAMGVLEYAAELRAGLRGSR